MEKEPKLIATVEAVIVDGSKLFVISEYLKPVKISV